jgi:hypothetical protein
LTAGSLQGPDAVLTSTFHEQHREIGWYHFCLGRISRQWASAVTQYNSTPLPDAGLQWSSLLIATLWRFSCSLWKYRNEVVHGATVEDQVQLQLSQLQEKIVQYYTAYEENPSIVLPRHQIMFTSRTMEERIKTSYDSMAAWICSVDEAIQVLLDHGANLREVPQVFFHRSDHSEQESDSDSTFSYHSTDSVGTPSLDPTVATTVTTQTMSSVALSASALTYLIYNSNEDSICSVDASLDFSHVSRPLDDPRGSACSSPSFSSDTSSNGWDDP